MTPERLAEIAEDWCTFDDVVELIAAYRAAQQSSHDLRAELEIALSDAKESLDGKSLCAGKECKMHCGLGQMHGCESVKAYLKENGGQVD